MGTAASHAGSSKIWDEVADDGDLNDWLDSLPDGDSGDEDPVTDPEPTSSDEGPFVDRPEMSPLPPSALRRIARGMRSGGDGPGVGGGGARGGRAQGSAGGTAGGGRTRAGRAGGRTVAGVSAYQRGDAATLSELGLSLDDLGALDDDWDRAVAIADAAVGDDPSGEDDEDARWAAVQAASWAFGQDSPPDPREIIEQFVADYVYRKVSYEIGNRRRDGHTDGAESVGSEASLRAGIRVCVRSEIEADFSAGRSVGDLSDLVDRVYEYTLDVWAES